MFRVLELGENPVIKNIYSFEFIKIVLFLFSKILLQAYALAMSLKSLMYYFVLFEAGKEEFFFLNIYFRGITKGPALITFTQVTLVIPLFILIVLYLPTFIYIALINIKNFRKNMNVTDIAIFIIFPMFTSLCFRKTTDEGNVKSNSDRLMLQNVRKSKSLPNIFAEDCHFKMEKRTKSAIDLEYRDNTATANFSLLHSNVIYLMFVTGNWLVMAGDIAIQLHRHSFAGINPITQVFLIIFILNILLWADFN